MEHRAKTSWCQGGVLILLMLACLCTIATLITWPRLRQAATSPHPPPPGSAPYTPWPTPPTVQSFDYPLQPAQAYGPHVQGTSGFRAIDTRYGAQNPALGSRSNCFRDRRSNPVPFSQLYHAGVDLFAFGRLGQLLWDGAAANPVRAVADGVVMAALDAGTEGQILITEHRLPDQSPVYAVYWHVDHLAVTLGQPVTRGQVIASVCDQGLNSHLHWEMRTFLDGSDLFPSGSAGARGSCNSHAAGVGYTWDDTPERARPAFYGYLDPLAFVADHQ